MSSVCSTPKGLVSVVSCTTMPAPGMVPARSESKGWLMQHELLMRPPAMSTRRMVTPGARTQMLPPIIAMSSITAPGVDTMRSPVSTWSGVHPGGVPVSASVGKGPAGGAGMLVVVLVLVVVLLLVLLVLVLPDVVG